MNKCTRSFWKIVKAPMFPMVVFWIVLAIAHIFFPVTNSDDAWFAQILAGDKATFENWIGFLEWRYEVWSSRLLIEGLLILMTRFPLIWRIGDTLIWIAISVQLMKLFNPERSSKKNWILLACTLLFPIGVIYEVGFIATSLNYSWPFAAALAALTPAVKHFYGRSVRRHEYILAFLMVILAGFQELLCATMVLAFLGSLVWRIVTERKFPKYDAVSLLLCFAMLIFALTCPGNDSRTLQETATQLPAHETLNLFQKIELGFSSMARTLFLDLNVFVLVFCTVLAVAVHRESKRLWQRAISVIPALFVLVFGTLGELLSPHLSFVNRLRSSIPIGSVGTGLILTEPLTWIPDLIFASILGLILLSLRFAVKNKKQYYFLFFLLALGAASRIALGLSPTVWASAERICTFLYVAMSVALAWLLVTLFRKPEKTTKRSRYGRTLLYTSVSAVIAAVLLTLLGKSKKE